jgi:hypothetical protein
MTRALIELDFARSRPRMNWRGAVLLAIGAAACIVVATDYRDLANRREGLDMRLEGLHAKHRTVKPDKATERLNEEAGVAFAEISTPWSQLLQELEVASAESSGSVAVLGIEPDRDKHQIRVLAEARTLPGALAYVERLQKSQALRYPMLESHEVQQKDPQRPVRFQIRADWSISP